MKYFFSARGWWASGSNYWRCFSCSPVCSRRGIRRNDNFIFGAL